MDLANSSVQVESENVCELNKYAFCFRKLTLDGAGSAFKLSSSIIVANNWSKATLLQATDVFILKSKEFAGMCALVTVFYLIQHKFQNWFRFLAVVDASFPYAMVFLQGQ